MYYFIVNEHGGSGKAKKTWSKVKAMMKEKKIEYKAWESKYEGHATKLAKHISELEDDDIRLIVLGGDGTMNEVLNGMSHFDKVRVGLIPTGSGNDLARGLDIPRDTKLALEKILNSQEDCTIDLGIVTREDGESRIFAISSGIGMDAIVCRKASLSKLKKVLNKVKLGKFTYILMTVYTLFSMDNVKTTVQFDNQEPIDYDKMIFIANMNVRAEGGGVPMAPGARFDDGLLSVCIAHGIPRWRAFLALPRLVAAKHMKIKGFSITDCKEVDIITEKPMTLHADGEYGGEVSHIRLKCLENKLRMML